MQRVAESTAEFRASVVKGEAPRVLLWIAGVVLLLTVLNAAISNAPGWTSFMYAGVVVVCLGGAWLTTRPGTRPLAMPWIVVACATALIIALELEMWLWPTAVGMAYILIGIVSFAPFVLDPLAAGIAAVPMMIGYAIVVLTHFPDDALTWLGVALGAVLIGGLLLRVRLNGIDALAALTRQSRELATRDPLTGALNRRGLEDRVAGVAATARRHEEPVFVVFVDVNGLKAANDAHGHDFGDDVIRATANAIRGIVRASDLVCRWGGDEFVILGTGMPTPHDALVQRISDRLAGSGLPPELWSDGVSLGIASASALDLDFDELVLRADRDMYARRRVTRET